MRVYCLLSIAVVMMVFTEACKKQSFQIKGTVTNAVFEGEKVYLIPLDAPSSNDVDSVQIKDGKFYFQHKADSLGVRILRVKTKFSEYLQDLIVVLDPGVLNVKLARRSSGQGTRLNNKLQKWKVDKAKSDSLQWSIQQRKMSERNLLVKDSLTTQLNLLKSATLAENIKLIKSNCENGVGLFLFKICYRDIPETDKNEILIKAHDAYLEKDEQLKTLLQSGR